MLFPGFLLALGFFPILKIVSDKINIPFEISFTLTVILLGWFIVVLDMYIYMAYEGRRYWPKWLRKWFLNRESKRLEKLIRASESSDYETSLEAWVELGLFPVDKKTGEFKVRYPTRLGNLCTAFEDYPSRIYGMDSVFYWPRIWLTLDKDIREEISNQQALADSTVYCSGALFT
jgi:hypothetical protein